MVKINQDFILIRSWNKIVLSASAFYPKTRKIAYFNIPCELKTRGKAWNTYKCGYLGVWAGYPDPVEPPGDDRGRVGAVAGAGQRVGGVGGEGRRGRGRVYRHQQRQHWQQAGD